MFFHIIFCSERYSGLVRVVNICRLLSSSEVAIQRECDAMADHFNADPVSLSVLHHATTSQHICAWVW